MPIARLAALALATSLAACGGPTTSIIGTNAPPRPLTQRALHEVEVFTAGVPQRPFVEIAVIQARNSGAYGPAALPGLIGDMRREAALAGCDALLVYGDTNPVATAAPRRQNPVTSGLWGACVVYGFAVPVAPVPAPTAPVAGPTAPVAGPTAPVAAGGPGVFARMFVRLDVNRDGILSPEEIPDVARASLLRFDTSGEGWLTRDEMEAADRPAPRREPTHAWGRLRER
jgi:hypothetical protein